MDNTAKIVEKLREKRKQLGLSQKELAARCGMPQSTIGRIEVHIITPQLSTIMTIAEKLGCSIDVTDLTQSKWNGTEIVAYWQDEITAKVKIENNRAYIERLTDDKMKQFFPPMESMDLALLSELFETRCWDRGRGDIDEILKRFGLTEYDPMELVKRTFGLSYNDFKWFKFEPNILRWNHVNPRRDEDV